MWVLVTWELLLNRKIKKYIVYKAEILESRETGAINIVCRDFNADMVIIGGSRGSKAATKQAKSLAELVKEFGYTVCNMNSYATGPVVTFIGFIHVTSKKMTYLTPPTNIRYN